MKFMHLSDLHIGKKLNGYQMIDDQKFILSSINHIAKKYTPDSVLICGDIYDKLVPSTEAVTLFDGFITELASVVENIFIISGNHDSAERLAFGSSLMRKGIYISPVFNIKPHKVTLNDEYGNINIYMLPFLKPASVRTAYPEKADEISNYTDAVRLCITAAGADKKERSVIMAHQFVTGAVRCESEDITVGGLDNVDASVFDGFDYTALGHIHCKQNIGKYIRYCGSPLKYSFSEINNNKSVTFVEIKEKGSTVVSEIPLEPLHEMREIKGTYNLLSSLEYYKNSKTDDLLRVILTDEDDVIDAVSRLRTIYPNILSLSYDNKRSYGEHNMVTDGDTKKLSPIDSFNDLYKLMNNTDMSENQRETAEKLINEVWGDEQ